MENIKNYKIRYVIFSTKWGYFGLAGNKSGLIRTHLPDADYSKVEKSLLKGLDKPQFDKDLFKTLQKKIKSFFEGKAVSFDDVPVNLEGFTDFTVSVLNACRKIDSGQTLSYQQLAKKAGTPKAVRAVGSVMAKNPLPLIIPCHRVIKSTGQIGNFTAGKNYKKHLLSLEKR